MAIKPEEVKALRDKLGITQTKLAELLQVSPRTVQQWEQGLRKPNYTSELYLKALPSLPDFSAEVPTCK